MEFQGWFETLTEPGPGAGVEEDTGTEFTLVTSLTRDVFRNVPHYRRAGQWINLSLNYENKQRIVILMIQRLTANAVRQL